MSISEGEGRNNKFIFLFFLLFFIFAFKCYVFANSLYRESREFEYVVEDVKCMANIYMEAYELTLNDNFVGYVANEDTVNKALKNIENKYAEKASKNGFLVEDVSFDTKIELKKNNVLISEISDEDKLSKEILETNELLNGSLVNIIVDGEKEEVVSVEPDVEVIKVDNMYLGDNKIEVGEDGEKKVKKKITFINGKEVSSEILEQQVLKDAENTKVYKGIKNPISSSVEFLSHPTRGGVITSIFGEKSRGGHRGVDIGVPFGTPIGAACDGVVTFVGYNDIYGNMVKIRHDDNTETLYAHASEILTTVGKEVKKGETIAKVGSTGRSTGPHLHLELIYKGNPINPMDYIIKN